MDKTGLKTFDELTAEEKKKVRERMRKNQTRRERDQAMRDLGMTKVRGNLGGTYWE